MAAKLSPYHPPAPIRSSLLKNPPDAVPPTDELDLLHAELKAMKQRTFERSKKAGEDLRTIEESMRRMKEREKGKAKATEKVKRERDYTPLPDADEPRLSSQLHSHSSKPRMTAHPNHSVQPSSSRSSVDPRSAADELRKKKKKRKREFDDSDIEIEPQRPRKTTPPTHQAHNHHPPPVKAQKSISSNSHSHSKPPAGPDFNLPPAQPLLPLRPPIPPPPIPGPSKPTEVTEDFSKLKQPQQILVTSFYTSIEPWIRNIREEDIGFLEHVGDEVEPYVMPKLGRHYSEVWEDQDMGAYPLLGEAQDAPPSAFGVPLPRWDPSTLTEQDCLVEEKGHGPLTERVISALLPVENNTWKGVKAAEDAMEGRPGGGGAAASRKEKMNVSDLEVRIGDTMRFHGLLNDIPDYSEKVDDPIATALRHAQRELRTVVATNKARKTRLAAVARDRLGYQEYLELRDSIDKNITTTFSKLQKKDVPKVGKKKKKGVDTNGDSTPVPGLPPPCPAALGLAPDEENQLLVSEQLKQLVETRRHWVDAVGGVFEEKQEEYPGRIWRFPKESIFEGIDEEVREMLLEPPADPRQSSKGKDRERSDEMDVG